MKLTQWMVLAYSVCGVLFLAISAKSLLGSGAAFPLGTMLFAAAYCGLCMLLLLYSTGPGKTVMLVALAGILASFVIRLLLLSFDETRYLYSDIAPLTAETVQAGLMFLTLGTLVFWSATRLITIAFPRASQLPPAQDPPMVGQHRNALIVFGILVAAISMSLRYLQGTQLTESSLGFMTRLLPLDAMNLLLTAITVNHWRDCKLPEKAGLVIFLGLSVLATIAIGGKGALLNPLLWLVVTIAVHSQRLYISRLWVGLGLMMGALLLPAYLEFISLVRDGYYISGNALKAPIQLFGTIGLDLGSTIAFLSNRLAGFDALVATIYFPRDILTPYIGIPQIVSAAAGQLVPDAIWASSTIGVGKVFAFFFQGIPLYVVHDGAFLGFGMAFALFAWWGLVFLAALGFFATAGFVWLSRRPVWGAAFSTYFLFQFVLIFFMEGNLDILISHFISNVAVIVLILWVLQAPQKITGPIDPVAKPARRQV